MFVQTPDCLADKPGKVSGLLERVVFRSPDTDFSVIRVKVEKKKDLVSVVGITSAQPGESLEAEGFWKQTESWGLQLSATKITSVRPTSPDGLAKYLGSGLIPGIGPGFAKKIIAHFGAAQTLVILDEEPMRLLEVKGMGEKRTQRIIAGWVEQKAVNKIMLFLNEHNVSPALCRKIYKKYEHRSIEKIQEDPYRLALEVTGIGFKTADAIATSMGVAADSPQRIRAGLVYLMQDASSTGNCGVPRGKLLTEASAALTVPMSLVATGLEADLKLGDVRTDDSSKKSMMVEHNGVVYLRSLAAAEENIARTLIKLSKEAPPWRINAEEAVTKAEKELGVSLARQQREAVMMAVTSKVSVLTGGPGTGKTTTLTTILHVLKSVGVSIAGCAPTGKAAKRATEVTGLPFSTLHRALKMKGVGKSECTIENDILVIDEGSMLDVPLTNNVMRSLSANTAVLLVGDVDQLPSVGPGQVLKDTIDSGVLPVTRLTEVFRQAAGSLIIRNAHRINHGEMPEKGLPTDDFFMVGVPEKNAEGVEFSPEEIGNKALSTIVDLVSTRLPKHYGLDPLTDIQVLCPMNRSVTGVFNMNTALQKVLNPEPCKFMDRFGTRFGVGDKVIQTKNNYDLDIFNGDQGFIQDIDHDEKIVSIMFDTLVEIPFDDMDDVKLAYAMTIHKSQGSQAPAIIIPMTMQHFVMLQRNLLYTGVTRAKRVVVLVGQSKAIAMACSNDSALRRISRLKNLLQQGSGRFR